MKTKANKQNKNNSTQNKNMIKDKYKLYLSWDIETLKLAYCQELFVNGHDIKSCMWNKGNYVIEFYPHFKAGVAILTNHKQQWIGRCIIWKYKNVVLFDKLHTTNEHLEAFEHLLKQRNCIQVTEDGAVINNKQTHIKLKTNYKCREYPFVPFLDTVKYMDAEGNICTATKLGSKSYPFLCNGAYGYDPRTTDAAYFASTCVKQNNK